MTNVIAASMRQRECRLPVANASRFVGEIGQPMGDEIDDLTLALNAAMDRHHAGRKDDAR